MAPWDVASRLRVRPDSPSLSQRQCRIIKPHGFNMRHTMTAPLYHGGNKRILGIVLAVITFWLFAQTTLNVAPEMQNDLRISESVSKIAVSITALFGDFIVVAGRGWRINLAA